MNGLPEVQYLKSKRDNQLAYRHHQANEPTIVFLSGFRSAMDSIKAQATMQWCVANDYSCLCFDYSGHGLSSGEFAEGTIGEWLEDAETVFDTVESGKKVLLGSSMGGWIALLLALRHRSQIAGIMTIACAADFISGVLRPALRDNHLKELADSGVTHLPSNFPDDGPYLISQKLLDEADQHQLLNSPIPLKCPVELVHGYADLQIPWETSLKVTQLLNSQQTTLTLIKDGTHRLSRPEDLDVLFGLLEKLINKTG